MVNKTIPALDPVLSPALTDRLAVRQAGDTENKRMTALQLKNLLAPVQLMDAIKSTTPQTLVKAVYTEIILDTEITDVNNWYNPANGRFTPQVAGWYEVYAAFCSQFASIVSPAMQIRKNGSLANGDFLQGIYAGNMDFTGGIALPMSGKLYCNGTTDYISMHVYHNSAADKQTNTTNNNFTYLRIMG